MKQIDCVALFRLSVLGQLVSRECLQRGELQQVIRELAQREYAIPGSERTRLGEKTIEAWYYAWRKDGIDGLTPKVRVDLGQSKLAPALQEAVLAAKRENPKRSIRQIQRLLEAAGLQANLSLSRSASLLTRHMHGDWGDTCRDDAALNELAINDGSRIMSVYRLVDAGKLKATPKQKRADLPTVWVITDGTNEAGQREVTTLLLPQDY